MTLFSVRSGALLEHRARVEAHVLQRHGVLARGLLALREQEARGGEEPAEPGPGALGPMRARPTTLFSVRSVLLTLFSVKKCLIDTI